MVNNPKGDKMKKIIALTSVLALAACGISSEQIAQHDADFAGCERVDTTNIHLVYKCPSTMEWVAKVKDQEPNALFQQGGNLNWDEVNADTGYTYVEVVPSKPGTDCKENFHYRTMVKPFNRETREFFAVLGCK